MNLLLFHIPLTSVASIPFDMKPMSVRFLADRFLNLAGVTVEATLRASAWRHRQIRYQFLIISYRDSKHRIHQTKFWVIITWILQFSKYFDTERPRNSACGVLMRIPTLPWLLWNSFRKLIAIDYIHVSDFLFHSQNPVNIKHLVRFFIFDESLFFKSFNGFEPLTYSLLPDEP